MSRCFFARVLTDKDVPWIETTSFRHIFVLASHSEAQLQHLHLARCFPASNELTCFETMQDGHFSYLFALWPHENGRIDTRIVRRASSGNIVSAGIIKMRHCDTSQLPICPKQRLESEVAALIHRDCRRSDKAQTTRRSNTDPRGLSLEQRRK